MSASIAGDTTNETLKRGFEQLEAAMRDPEKAKILHCRGLGAYLPGPVPSPAECAGILKGGSNGAVSSAETPPLSEYKTTVLAVRRALVSAQFAAMCRLRSDAYYQAVTASARKYLQVEARRLHLSESDISTADAEVQRTLQQETAGRAQRQLGEICQELATSPKLAAIDSLFRQYR